MKKPDQNSNNHHYDANSIFNALLKVNRRIDDVHDRIDDVHKRTDAIHTKIDGVAQRLEEKIDSKFDGHNDYHVNLEHKWTIRFKIILGGLLTFMILVATGLTKEVITELLPLFTLIWHLIF